MFRFIHSSDLHLGKPFGRYSEDVRGRLRQARHGVLARLAQAAREHGAPYVMLAGDTFDQETPAPSITRQALNAMAQAQDVTWILMPGNHDSLDASELWETIARDKPDNLRLALTPQAVDLGGTCVLPAPCTARNPGRDLTKDMDQETPPDTIRIGLGHGGITDFASMGSDAAEGPSGTIAPNRAALAGLDYLGLGDWHGQLKVNADTWYCGTPETDSFKHAPEGTALAVSIAGPGAPPQVTPVKTGEIGWHSCIFDLTPQSDSSAELAAALPPLARRRDAMVRIVLRGRAGVQQMQKLNAMMLQVAPDFMNLSQDVTQIRLAHDVTDLDAIDPSGGALRQAAKTLSEQAQNADLSAQDRQIAATALSQLFSFAAEHST